jgi:CHASE3 domain sensor protein
MEKEIQKKMGNSRFSLNFSVDLSLSQNISSVLAILFVALLAILMSIVVYLEARKAENGFRETVQQKQEARQEIEGHLYQ